MSTIVIPRPSKAEVETYLTQWERLPGYFEQEQALDFLFHETFPNNTDLRQVMLKCSVLNDFYSTNLHMIPNGIVLMAEHIVRLDVDQGLAQGDADIVNAIAQGPGRYDFSFATKFCSHHNDRDYAIYDNYVKRILAHFKAIDHFADFKATKLREYSTFKQAIETFRSFYSLDEYSLKQIDQYLWQLGKAYFRKKY